jgi:multidrug transporter EmrE-like cation transporter
MIVNTSSLILFTFMLACGQVLFKKVGSSIRDLPPTDAIVLVLTNPGFYGAVGLYGVSTLLWIWILSRVPLSQAYPWVAGGIVIVPLIGWYFFNERIRATFWVGVALIIAGILIIQCSSRS